MEEIEEWRDIPGYEGYYQVSNLGRVRSLDRVIKRSNGVSQTWMGKILKPKSYSNGYLFVCLSSPEKVKYSMIHRLVAQVFLDNPNGLPIVNHKDEDKANNVASNLEWCTQEYNVNYGNAREKWISGYKKKGYAKRVWQFTLDGTLVGEYESIVEASISTGVKNINSALSGKSTNAGNFLWSYTPTPPTFRYGLTTRRRVCEMDENGLVIHNYKSMREAAKHKGVTHHKIAEWCRSDNSLWKINYE